MDKKEIKDYLKRVDELETKLTGEDKETYAWLIYGYNQCAKLLNEKEQQCKKQKEVIDKIESLIKSKDNGTCIHNNERRGAYTFVLNFDEAREFVWNLEDILKEVSE